MTQSPPPQQERPTSQWLRVSALGVILALLIANAISLGSYPAPHCDEANHLAVSYTFFHEGRFTLPYMGDVGSFGQNFSTQGRLYQIGKGLVLQALGYTITAGRAVSLLGWLVAIGLTYLAGRLLYDETVGLASAVALAASVNAFYASHIGREEIWIMAVAAGLLAATEHLHRKPGWVSFALLGVGIAAAADIHPNALWFALPAVAILIRDNRKAREGRIRLGWLAAAGVLAGAAVITAHLLPDPAVTLADLRYASRYNDLAGGGLVQRIGSMAALLWATDVTGLGGGALPLTASALAGLIVALRRREEGDRLLLTSWAVSLLAFTLLIGYRSPFYGRLWEPYLALAAGAGMVRLGRAIAAHRERIGAGLAAGLLLTPVILAGLGAMGWLAYRFGARDTQAYYAQITELVPAGEPVMGEPTLWPLFNGRNPFTADETIRLCELAETCDALSESEFAKLLAEQGAGYVVDDGSLGCGNLATPASAAWSAALEATCTPVGAIENRWFGAGGQTGQGGPTRIFRCD